MRSRTLRALGISLVLLPGFIAAEVNAQYIPVIFSEEPKGAASVFYQVLEDQFFIFNDRKELDVELTGIRLRRNLTHWLGLEATAGLFVGSGRHYGTPGILAERLATSGHPTRGGPAGTGRRNLPKLAEHRD